MHMSLPPVKVVPTKKVKPYFTNPRHIPEDAIEAVRSSIDTYGYAQPILVDSEYVIISGHTRYGAVQALDVTRVAVMVVDWPEAKARRFRIIDNRLAELNDWSHDKLVAEVREWPDEVKAAYFDDLDLEIGATQATTVTEKQIEEGALKAATVTQAARTPMTEVECPGCQHVFQVKTSTLPGLSPEDLDALMG